MAVIGICYVFGLLLLLENIPETTADHEVIGALTEKPQVKKNLEGRRVLDIWYYRGESANILHLWKTCQIAIDFPQEIGPIDYTLYQNSNQSEVEKAHEGSKRIVNAIFRKLAPTWQPATYLQPFAPTYVGLDTDSTYKIALKVKNIDFRLTILFVTGILLFFSAPKLSRSTYAFYAGGTTLGVVGSLIVVIFLLYRVAPKRSMAVTILLGGWSVVTYLLYIVWSNLYVIMTDYYRLVAAYLVSVASISFAVSYWLGPPKGVRTLNLVQWALQLIAVVMIYAGSQLPSVSAAAIVISVIVYNLPHYFDRHLRWISYRLFPPSRRLLTEDEYIAEGSRETRKALEELRQYCKSPGCDSWKVMSRLNSPQQFAEFVSGERSHIGDDEILRYSNESFVDDLDWNDDVEEEESGSKSSENSGVTNDRFFERPTSADYRFGKETTTTPTRLNQTLGPNGLRQRNGGVGERYHQSYGGKDSAPLSAPSNLTRNSRYAFR